MTNLYKVLGHDGALHHGGTGTWHQPHGKRPGKWMPTITPVVPCLSGYHLCTIDQLVGWLGPVIWVAEGRGEHVDHGDKHVFAQARLLHRLDTWDERTARLFAADCAEHVLPIFEKAHPGDDRPRKAIEVARRFAHDEATPQERDAIWTGAWFAARDATWAATRGAVGGAAWAAAWAATWAAARAETWAAARAATRGAARAAVGAAAWDATWDAERTWQTTRLTHYLEVTP